jgi:hypothetical protein
MRHQSTWGAIGVPSRRRRALGQLQQSLSTPGPGEFAKNGNGGPFVEGPPSVDLEIDSAEQGLLDDIDFDEFDVTPSTPGAVPVRPGNWNLDAKPFATYKIASGDTFVGLAATYLGDGGRWKDIWQTGSNQQQFPSPDSITHTGPLDMPDEARDKLIAFLKLPPEERPAQPGNVTDEQAKKIRDRPKRLIAGAVAVVAAGTLGYLVYRAAS